MVNLIIEKTASEEGRYGEIIAENFYKYYTEFGGTNKKYAEMKLVDKTKDKNYQKIDCDFCDENSNPELEVKHDTWIAGKKDNYPTGTGNVPYEIATHVSPALKEKIKTFTDTKTLIKIDEILDEFPELRKRYVGCNEKTTANNIFLVGGEEEKKENRRYKLKKIWVIRNEQFKKYAHSISAYTFKNQGESWLHFPWQGEDKCYNIVFNIPVKKLIKEKIASEMPDSMINKMKEKFPALNEYHTSQEIEKLIK